MPKDWITPYLILFLIADWVLANNLRAFEELHCGELL